LDDPVETIYTVLWSNWSLIGDLAKANMQTLIQHMDIKKSLPVSKPCLGIDITDTREREPYVGTTTRTIEKIIVAVYPLHPYPHDDFHSNCQSMKDEIKSIIRSNRRPGDIGYIWFPSRSPLRPRVGFPQRKYQVDLICQYKH